MNKKKKGGCSASNERQTEGGKDGIYKYIYKLYMQGLRKENQNAAFKEKGRVGK